MTNPFAPAVPQQAPPAAPGNPFASPAPATPQGYGAQLGAPQAYTPPAPTSVAAAPAPTLDLSRLAPAPAPIVGEAGGADLEAMFGRLLLIFPLQIERVPPYKGQEVRSADGMRDRLTATVVVLDDGRGGQSPIQWGGNLYGPPSQQRPHTDSAPLPYIRKAMWLNQSRLISQLRGELPTPANGNVPGMIAGRLSRAGQETNAAWYLIGATDAEVALVRQYLEAVQAGHVPHPLA